MWEQWADQAKSYFEQQWGINSTCSFRFALLFLYLYMYGFTPRITSGYRDPAKQRQMQQDWDAGRRQGLKARPATNSKHTQGRALDVDIKGWSSRKSELLAIAQAVGLRWGSDADYVHWDYAG